MIYEALNVGKENARSAKELADILEVDEQSIPALVKRERDEGCIICSGRSGGFPGYYRPANREELKQYCDKLKHTASELIKEITRCARAMQVMDK